jgi:hypothetical protein
VRAAELSDVSQRPGQTQYLKQGYGILVAVGCPADLIVDGALAGHSAGGIGALGPQSAESGRQCISMLNLVGGPWGGTCAARQKRQVTLQTDDAEPGRC